MSFVRKSVLAVGWVLVIAAPSYGQPPPIEIIRTPAFEQPRIMPPADLEEARLRYHLYRRYEYPARMQQLEHAIRMAQAELAALDRHIAEYQSIQRPVTSSPFMVTLDSASLRRQAVAMRLAELQRLRLAERSTFVTQQLLKQREILRYSR
ncbi:MAG: hypothetical protein KatS3mg110_1592 [Pirellulaceae bacterium]|nr:MAG: hypothetical protein KatS3mg110_1592 [Pirellulaceae bacterium]